jgi:hypothetical protein
MVDPAPLCSINTTLNTSTRERKKEKKTKDRERGGERGKKTGFKTRGDLREKDRGEQGVQKAKPLDNERRESKTKHQKKRSGRLCLAASWSFCP